MEAKEMIERLQKLVDKYGNLPVKLIRLEREYDHRYNDENCLDSVDFIEYNCRIAYSVRKIEWFYLGTEEE